MKYLIPMTAFAGFSTILLTTMPMFAADAKSTNATPDGLDCFVNLTPPEFPVTALQAHTGAGGQGFGQAVGKL